MERKKEMNIGNNKYYWEYGRSVNWDYARVILARNVGVDVSTKTIYISKNVCPLPVFLLYSYIKDFFDSPSHMPYEIPMSAQTAQGFTIINDYKLCSSNVLVGKYLSQKGTRIGLPSMDRYTYENGNVHYYDPNNREAFIGDYILYMDKTHPYRNKALNLE